MLWLLNSEVVMSLALPCASACYACLDGPDQKPGCGEVSCSHPVYLLYADKPIFGAALTLNRAVFDSLGAVPKTKTGIDKGQSETANVAGGNGGITSTEPAPTRPRATVPANTVLGWCDDNLLLHASGRRPPVMVSHGTLISTRAVALITCGLPAPRHVLFCYHLP